MNPWHALALVWSIVAVIIGGAVWRLAAVHGYRGRHRLADRLHALPGEAAATVAAEAPAVSLFVPFAAGRSPVPPIPRPRAPLASPWGTPAWVDEWAAEHEPALVGSRAAA